MTRHFWRLLGTISDGTSSNFFLILAALCTLICVLGFMGIARCAWLRRLSSEQQSPNSAEAANRALKKKILRSLPKTTISPDSASKFSDCAICLAEYVAGDEIRVLPNCNHVFHMACIDTWLGSHSSCPSCRQILLQPSPSIEKCVNLTEIPASSAGSGVGDGGGQIKSAGRQHVVLTLII